MQPVHTDCPSVRNARSPLLAAAICWALATATYMGGEALAASAFPNYSYATNYISDLGIPNIESLGGRIINSPLHAVMNTAFILQGALFATGAICAVRRARFHLRIIFLVLAMLHALGIIMVGSVHGGQENAANGLGQLHLLGAVFAFVSGNLASITGGIILTKTRAPRATGYFSIALGLIGIIGFVMLQVDARSAVANILPDGAWERMSMYAIIAWQSLIATVIMTRARRHKRRRNEPIQPQG